MFASMKSPAPRARRQAGYLLLETMIAIVVFGIGILGIVSLYASSIKGAGGTKFRTDASLVANEVIGQMWAGDRLPSSLKANFQGGPQTPSVTDGTFYTAWAGRVQALLPGVTATSNAPTIAISCLPDATSCDLPNARSLVVVTVRWLMPGEPSAHSFISTAEISQ